MIGKLTGTVLEATGEAVILDVQGVGYEVSLPATAPQAFRTPGERVSLFIHTHVREDDLRLFGFSTASEKAFFLQLMSVTGIGAKSAMQIVSSGPIAKVVSALRARDVATLQKLPGIGKKTAERLVLELSDKVRGVDLDDPGMPVAAHDPKSQVVSALLNLGYKRAESEQAVARVDESTNGTFDRLLKESLKALGRP